MRPGGCPLTPTCGVFLAAQLRPRPPQDAPRRVPYDPDGRVVHRAHDALGHRLLADAEGGVDRSHHEVELGEEAVLVVERAVLEDVHLGAAEEPDLPALLVGPPHARALLLETL